MISFNCIHCGSSKIKLVKSIFESETEAQYKNQNDFTKVPSTKEILQQDDNITITSQTALANKLSNLALINEEYWKDFIDLEKYNKKLEEKKQAIRTKELEEIEINREPADNPPVIPSYGKWSYDYSSRVNIGTALLIIFITLFFLIMNPILNAISPFLQTLWVISFFSILIILLLDAFYLTNYITIKHNTESEIAKKIKPLCLKIRSFEERFKSKSKVIKKIRDKYENKLEEKMEDKLLPYIEKMENKNNTIKQEIYKIEQEGKQKIENINKKKLDIWSNLYYCYDCDHVMDLDTNLYNNTENINQLVSKVLSTKF